MATYAELRAFYGDENLATKVEVASVIVAQEILTGNDDSAPYDQALGKHDARVIWAQSVVENTASVAQNILKLVLAANAGATVAQISGASDSAVLSNVRDVVDSLSLVSGV